MKKLLTVVLILMVSTAFAGTLTVTTTAGQDAALAAIVQVENAARAAKLTALNAQRDKALPSLTAAEAGLAPVSASDVLLALAVRSMKPELEAIKAAKDAAKVEAVDAITARAVDCSAKASAAGLDPLAVCK